MKCSTGARELSTITVITTGGGLKYFEKLRVNSKSFEHSQGIGVHKHFELFYLNYACQCYGLTMKWHDIFFICSMVVNIVHAFEGGRGDMKTVTITEHFTLPVPLELNGIQCVIASTQSRGGVHPYLGNVGRFRGDDPRFFYFKCDWVPILYLNTIRLTPLFLQKKSVCLYHI